MSCFRSSIWYHATTLHCSKVGQTYEFFEVIRLLEKLTHGWPTDAGLRLPWIHRTDGFHQVQASRRKWGKTRSYQIALHKLEVVRIFLPPWFPAIEPRPCMHSAISKQSAAHRQDIGWETVTMSVGARPNAPHTRHRLQWPEPNWRPTHICGDCGHRNRLWTRTCLLNHRGSLTRLIMLDKQALAPILVGGRHFWLFVLAGGPSYILYTYLTYHWCTLCIYTTICIFDGPPAMSKSRPPKTMYWTAFNSTPLYILDNVLIVWRSYGVTKRKFVWGKITVSSANKTTCLINVHSLRLLCCAIQ